MANSITNSLSSPGNSHVRTKTEQVTIKSAAVTGGRPTLADALLMLRWPWPMQPGHFCPTEASCEQSTQMGRSQLLHARRVTRPGCL